MESFIVDTDHRLEDLRALEAAARLRAARLAGTGRRLATRLVPIGFSIVFLGGMAFIQGSNARSAWVFGGLAVLIYFLLIAQLARRNLRPMSNGNLLGKARYEFGPEGFRIVRRLSEGTVRWPQVLGVDLTAAYLILWIDTASGYAIPLRDLPMPLTAETFADRVRAFIAAAPRDADAEARAGGSPAPESSSPPATPAAHVSPWRELCAVGRALALRRFDASQVAGGDASILGLGAVLLAAWIGLDPLLYTDELEFDWYSVPNLAWVIGGTFALAWVLARLMRPRTAYRRVLLLTLGSLAIAIASSAAFALLPQSWFLPLLGLFTGYALMYFVLALRGISGTTQVRALLAGGLGVWLFILADNALLIDPSPWIYAQETDEDSGETDDDATWSRMSALQFGQQARIDADIVRIAAHATARPEMFFLGFAGNGRQHVFAEEIGLAAKVIGTRYHAQERELLLVNDARDPERWPLATPEALRHSLLALGSIMDADDVLFLALSSHGGEDGTLEVANAGMAPMSLGVEDLASMLRDAKIPRKVIVISACYAGAFLPVLADEHTTVITAAAADRTSFGCADDRDLTYFGEAFYRDALPGARTLQDAFETAKRDIAEREREERIEPSEPQARFAADADPRLR